MKMRIAYTPCEIYLSTCTSFKWLVTVDACLSVKGDAAPCSHNLGRVQQTGQCGTETRKENNTTWNSIWKPVIQNGLQLPPGRKTHPNKSTQNRTVHYHDEYEQEKAVSLDYVSVKTKQTINFPERQTEIGLLPNR